MANLLEWFTRGRRVFQGHALALPDDNHESFEHVDGTNLAADDFRTSGSMRLADTWRADFCETLPAYSYRATLNRAVGAHRSAG